MISKEVARSLLTQVGVVEDIEHLDMLEAGTQHSIYVVKLKNSKAYVIKALKLQGFWGQYAVEHFENTEGISEYVNAQLDCSIVAVKHVLSGEFVLQAEQKHYLIYPYYQSIRLGTFSAHQCAILGQLLAKIHNLPRIARQLKQPIVYRFDPSQWEIGLQAYKTEFGLEVICDFAYSCLKSQAKAANQMAIGHGDLNIHNILWLTDDKPLLIDWESAGLVEPGVELLALAVNVAGVEETSFRIENIAHTISAYQSTVEAINRPIVLSQIDYLKSLCPWFAWLDYNLKAQHQSHIIRQNIAHCLRAIERIYTIRSDMVKYF